MRKIALIIPCYNEEHRLRTDSLVELLDGTTADIYLANDGSRDATQTVIENFAAQHSSRCFAINYKQNSGKANTVYQTVRDLLDRQTYDYIGYFDADFSTPPNEIIRLLSKVDEQHKFILASRILLLNSGIKRKVHRHIIGRTILTIINVKFKLGIYDTQCGAKVFSAPILREAFYAPFKTSWLFDVEIFVRLKKKNLLQYGRELPINNWVDVEGSKLGWQTAFKIAKELYLLVKNY